ncbi:hypothetical protein CAPTEDRAFT_181291 [Capitella teleta]|uniref:Adenosine 5'-monophosphoramidase HINT3 n=1 Tax=Capitella teleta TaxID=283909 RepID=R7UAX0_CAPTE|nr:hypothetical protein CAPTEDRAFT_181291 [Capitella teleta]|eukprot:ELU03281.1 hypothetical protein CAPTEDRAFT_181291 [Capitella teleta]
MATKCVFCSIADGTDEKTTLLYRDDDIIVFKDIRPAAPHHYLVCPRQHISDAKCLTHEHIDMVESMISIGKQVLREQGGDPAEARLGFHWPPFHLVSHLHLHVISPQQNIGFVSGQVFRPNSWWFVTDRIPLASRL